MHKYIVEGVGTFLLALAISLSGSPIAIGLMLMALVYVGSYVSGGHYNPAVSLGVFLRGRLSKEDLFLYWASQFLGAFGGLWVFGVVTETVFSPDAPMELSQALLPFGIEALMTMLLVLVFLTVVFHERYRANAAQGIVIGLTLSAIASTASFGIFNPAIASAALVWNLLRDGLFMGLAPALIFVAGPLLGGAAAAFDYNYLNGKNNAEWQK
jgi:glycerol uptake facilitator-like aquaporin